MAKTRFKFGTLAMVFFGLMISNSSFGTTAPTKPIALIITATKNTNEFRPYRTTFIRDGHRLVDRGYDVREVKLSDPDRLRDWATALPASGVGFVWFRAHGAPTAIEFSERYRLTSESLARDFDWLVGKLSTAAIIYLEACLTGSLEGDFTQNMQFAFAKLTLALPKVVIVAPSQSSCLHGFDIDEQGDFHFQMKPSPDSEQNIAVILGPQTKDILQTEPTNKDALLKSLTRDAQEQVLPVFMGDLDTRLLQIIRSESYAKSNFLEANNLIDKFRVVDADPNRIRGVFNINQTNPLFAAIFMGKHAIVQHLLEKGANFRIDYKGTSPLEYARQLALDPSKRNKSRFASQDDFEKVVRLLEAAQ